MGITETRGPPKDLAERSETDVLNSLGRVCTSEYMTSSLPARTSPLIRNTTTRYPADQIEHGIDILTVLASLRFATGTQLQRIIFDRSSDSPRQARHRATRAMRRLFDSGYLKRIPVFAPSASSGLLSRQLVNVLSPLGARTVGVEPRWVRTRAPKARDVLTHDFWLVELAVMAMEGCPEPLSITTWWDDRVLAARKRQGRLSLPNIPDGLLVVENLMSGKLYPCLVELDLGTESVASPARLRRDFARKIEGYLEYLGAAFREDFEIDAPPIVLIVAESERRLDSLRLMTQTLGAGGWFWFSTLPRLRQSVGLDASQTCVSTARQGPFWASNWQTAVDDDWRSLTTRCGA